MFLGVFFRTLRFEEPVRVILVSESGTTPIVPIAMLALDPTDTLSSNPNSDEFMLVKKRKEQKVFFETFNGASDAK